MIARSEHDLTVFDISPGARARFRDSTTVADSIEDAVRENTLVHICARDADQVRSVLFSENGVAS